VKETHHKWYSPTLGREIDLLVFGEWGYPIVLFPTSMGSFYENKDQGLIKAAEWFINSGKVKIYCVGSLDKESWYAKHLHPSARAYNYGVYDRFLNDELVPSIQRECNVDKIGVAGCSFGGYHALNFAFRHPDKVAYMFSMSGAFDIRSFMGDYYDDNVYFNNPPDYMQNEEGWRYNHMKIVLGTSEWDICLNDNQRMAQILSSKGIPHWLDVRGWESHDWPLWRRMFPEYISQMGL
jgi:esterase/lipase superfamily enzyme